MANLLPEEKETVCTTDEESKVWKIYSMSKPKITKMLKAGFVPVKVDEEGGHFFEVEDNQVSFRAKSTRVVSQEQKDAASERFKQMWKDKLNQEEV